MENKTTINNRRPIMALAASLLCLVAGTAHAGPIVAGDVDDFASMGGIDDTLVIRQPFANFLSRSGPGGNNTFYHNGIPMGFDELGDNNWEFGYTFENLPVLNSSASLNIHLKSLSGSDNDFIALQYIGDETSFDFLWSGSISDLDLLAGGTGSWEAGKDVILEIQLDDLPFGGQSIIGDVNLAGYLDVYVHDDTSVDWIGLNVPTPGTAALFALGGLAMVRRHRA